MEETVSMKMKLAELCINGHLKYVQFAFRLLFECQNLLISWIYFLGVLVNSYINVLLQVFSVYFGHV